MYFTEKGCYKMKNKIDLDAINDFILKENNLTQPIYYNNPQKTLRFDLKTQGEYDNQVFIRSLFKEFFCPNNIIYLISYYGGGPFKPAIAKKYFNKFSLSKVLTCHYLSMDKDCDIENPYLTVYCTYVSNFRKEKYLKDLVNSELKAEITFVSWKRGAAINFYSEDGCDVFIDDKQFLQYIKNKYSERLLQKN